MTTKCTNCPLRRHEIFEAFSKDEVQFMETFKTGEMSVEAGTQILQEGSSAPQLYTVLSGMGLRYKGLENGNRQVLNFVFPGDLVGLQAGVMGQNGYSFEASTPMRLCVFNRNDLWALFRSQPNRAFDLTWLAAVEEHFLGETLATLGQRSAGERIAWALLRTHERLCALDLANNGRVPFPYRQQDLADALGLSLVHTNKTLRKLRDRQLAAWTNNSLSVMNADGLRDMAMVEDSRPKVRPLL